MKMVVDFLNLDTDEEVRFEGSKEFPNLVTEDIKFMDAIQAVVDKYEDEEVTIDQGGDDDFYELNLPDGFFGSELAKGADIAQRLLADTEAALTRVIDETND